MLSLQLSTVGAAEFSKGLFLSIQGFDFPDLRFYSDIRLLEQDLGLGNVEIMYRIPKKKNQKHVHKTPQHFIYILIIVNNIKDDMRNDFIVTWKKVSCSKIPMFRYS